MFFHSLTSSVFPLFFLLIYYFINKRKIILNLIKDLQVNITGLGSFKEAIITNGGINVKEINPSTMESRLIKNLFFAGEIIDVHAVTGGYNLQIAFSTGYLAGQNLH